MRTFVIIIQKTLGSKGILIQRAKNLELHESTHKRLKDIGRKTIGE